MRPIDADALVSDIESARNMFFHSPYERRFHEDRIEFALNMVEDVPTIDYAPVIHASWVGIEYDGYADGYPVYDLWECSHCKHEHKGEIDTLTDYCPDCGAKMDGGKDDG